MAAGLAVGPHRMSRTIRLPILEDEYHGIVDPPHLFRVWLPQSVRGTPELLPGTISEGFPLKDRRRSSKVDVWLRRIRLRDGYHGAFALRS